MKLAGAQKYEADKQVTSHSKEPVCHQRKQCKNHVGNRLRKETKVVRNSSKAGKIFKKKKKDIEFEAKELGRQLTPLTRGNLGFLPHNHLIWGITVFPGSLPPLAKGA